MSVDVTVVSNGGQVIEVSVGEGAAVLDAIGAQVEALAGEAAARTAADTAIVGGADTANNTLGKISDRLDAVAVDLAGEIGDALVGLKGTADTNNNTLGKISDRLDATAVELAGEIGDVLVGIKGTADTNNNTLGKISDRLDAVAVDLAGEIGDVLVGIKGTADASNNTLGKIADRVTGEASARLAGDVAIVGDADSGNNTLGKVATRVDGVKATADDLATKVKPLAIESGYAFLIQDAAGRPSLAVLPDGTVAPFKFRAPAQSIDLTALAAELLPLLLSAPVGGMLRGRTEEQGGGFAITDAAGRAAMMIDGAGVTSFAKLLLPTATTAAVADAAKTAIGFKVLPPESGYTFALMDAAGRAPLLITTAGKVEIPNLLAASSASDAPSFSANYGLFPQLDASGRQQIVVTRKSDGQVFRLTSTGDNRAATLTSDDKVIYSRAGVRYYQPAEGGPEWQAEASAKLYVGIGDSLVETPSGVSWLNVMAVDLAASFINGGISAQATDQIIARVCPNALMTVTSNQIPASGPVAVTPSIALLTSSFTTAARSATGTLAGVRGTLNKDTSDAYTFTRAVAGSVVSCPAGTPFVPDLGFQAGQATMILWTGRNDNQTTYASFTQPLIAQAVAYMKTLFPRYLVCGVTPLSDGTENTGTTPRTRIDAHNAALATAYGGAVTFGSGGVVTGGGRFVDICLYLRTYGLALAGITPTTGDTTAIAAGCIPPSLMMVDLKHMNDAGKTVIGHLMSAIHTYKGWI